MLDCYVLVTNEVGTFLSFIVQWILVTSTPVNAVSCHTEFAYSELAISRSADIISSTTQFFIQQ